MTNNDSMKCEVYTCGCNSDSAAHPHGSKDTATKEGKGYRGHVSSILLSLLVILIPKCPACWVAYASILGLSGASAIPYPRWVLPAFVALLLINVYLSYTAARKTRNYAPLILSTAGIILILVSKFAISSTIGSITGICLIAAATITTQISRYRQRQSNKELSENHILTH